MAGRLALVKVIGLITHVNTRAAWVLALHFITRHAWLTFIEIVTLWAWGLWAALAAWRAPVALAIV